MQTPTRILSEQDFDAQLKLLENSMQKKIDTLTSINNSFYKFLDENPELKERYKEFDAGHPEENWDYNPELDQTHEEHREEDRKEEQQENEQEESLEESETKTRRSIR